MISRFRQILGSFAKGRKALPGRQVRRPRYRLEVEGLEERALMSTAAIPDVLTPREHLATVTGSDGRIYAIGGLDANLRAVNTVEAYDPTTNTWTKVAGMNTARFDLAAVAEADGRIYAIGGASTPGHAVSTVEVYDIAADTWSIVSSLSTPRELLTAVKAGGTDDHIYAIGGLDAQGNSLNTVEIYDPGTNQWSTSAATLANARAGAAAVTGSGGIIYVFGGGSGSVETYSPGASNWNQVSTMPTARSYLSAVTAPDGTIYVLGGAASVDGAVTGMVEAYQPTSNSWAIVDGLPSARVFAGAALGQDGNIYVVGGNDGQNVVKTTVSITPDTFHANANALFVNQIYQDLLRRPADGGGQAYWTGLLDNNKTNRVLLLLQFEGTFEYRAREVENLYETLLHRSADPVGLFTFANALGSGATVTQVEARLLASDEYYQTRGAGTTDGFLTALYGDVLGRAPDATGHDSLAGNLSQGRSRSDVVAAVYGSPESARYVTQVLYRTFLHREADASGIAFFTQLIQDGGTPELATSLLLASDEYFARRS